MAVGYWCNKPLAIRSKLVTEYTSYNKCCEEDHADGTIFKREASKFSCHLPTTTVSAGSEKHLKSALRRRKQ